MKQIKEAELLEVICRPRQCEADWLVVQAYDLALLAKEGFNSTLLIFACLEARNAIEQLWFELLMVIHEGEMSCVLFDKCRRRRDGYLASIKESEPLYRKLSSFTAIAINLDSHAPFEGIAWDLKRLKRIWQSLSNYCHAQAHPAATLNDHDWVSMAYALVEELYEYLHHEMSQGATALLKPANMTPEARLVWEDFCSDKISEEQARFQLRVIQPSSR